MRLLHTSELSLSEFVANPPPYAILSHTWTDEEVLFADLQGDPTLKTGWAKVTGACRIAKDHGYKWIWIDTCCIDKSSSAELSEAINSMFRWYEESKVCLAYLADVHLKEGDPRITGALERSRWFTRGWTLQELLAPAHMIFYTSEWDVIGLRGILSKHITEATGIHTKYIGRRFMKSGNPIFQASIAERMSWASQRETTRIEDIAYCLLGIFDVNMPLIYGEGINAYRRLQESIMQKTDDQSILAWGEMSAISNLPSTKTWRSLLADHPMAFRKSANIVPFETPYIKTRIGVGDNGITIESPICKAVKESEDHESGNRCLMLAPLLCQYDGDALHCIALMLTCDRNRKPAQYHHSTTKSSSCYRLTNRIFPAPKRFWVPERLFPAFLPYKLSLGTEGQTPQDTCIIRTLPHRYEARLPLNYTDNVTYTRTSSGRLISVGLGISPSFQRNTFRLGKLRMIPLQAGPDQDLTLIIQALYFHSEASDRCSSRYLPDSKYLIYCVAPGYLHGLEVHNSVQNELETFSMLIDSGMDIKAQDAGVEMPFDRVFLRLRRLNSGYSTVAVSTEDKRVTVSRNFEYDPNIFILDIKDSGYNVSAEVAIERYFEPLR